MSTDATPRLEAEVERMIKDRFPEGLVRVLEGQFPAASHADYEDAVATGFEKLVAAARAMGNPRGYMTTVAVNAMKRTIRRAIFAELPRGDSDDDEDETGDPWERIGDPWADPTAEQVISDTAYEFMRDLVKKWESVNVRTATLVVLEAGKLGEPISSTELAEELESQLGHEVAPSTARQWRKRGLDRLRAELLAADALETLED